VGSAASRADRPWTMSGASTVGVITAPVVAGEASARAAARPVPPHSSVTAQARRAAVREVLMSAET
jgi:hypothetical protein